MPLFEYICEECETIFERFVHAGENPIITCKSCGAEKVKKRFCPAQCSTIKDGKHTYHDEILKGVDKIYKKLSKGDDATFNDVAGD